MSELEPKLTPANENPWYVLMTLYGEQEGERVDVELHEKNRKAWNAWVGRGMSVEERAAASKSSILEARELGVPTSSQKFEMLERVADRHKAEMTRRNNDQFEYPGLPELKHGIDLSATAFDHIVSCSKFVFPAEVDFNLSAFRSDTIFFIATFREAVNCSEATFFSGADFGTVRFDGQADFFATIFTKGAEFRSASFRKNTNFDKALFKSDVDFGFTTFDADADFEMASFSAGVEFNSATFSGFVYFVDAKFGVAGANGRCHPLFRECQFEKPTSFRSAMFLDTYPDFSGATLHDKTTFRAKAQYWPKHPKQSAEEARESCAVIRHNVGNQGLPEDEHFFFRREMLFAGRYGPWPQRLTYQAFGWVSHYGASIARPVRALVTTVIAPAGMFAAALEKSGEGLNLADCFSGLALSFSNTFRLFGFQSLHFTGFYKDSDQILDAVAGAQTILGLVFLFFLGLGLRQRFRLR